MASEAKERLFDSSDDSASEEELNVFNEENIYAKKYNDWRRKEELQKLKDKYGDNLDIMSEIEDSEGGESGSDEDEDDESDSSESLSEEAFDEQFLKVYSALKSKAPEIYEKSFAVASNDKEEKNAAASSLKTKEKPKKFTLQDYHHKLIKEKKGITEEDEQMMKSDFNDDEEEKPSGYYEELYNIRQEINEIVNDDEGDESDQLFSVKEQQPCSSESHKSTSNKKDEFISKIWSNSKKTDKGEEFLKDYIVNKRYLDSKPFTTVKKFKEVDTHFGGFDSVKDDEESVEFESEHEEGESDASEEESQVQVAKHHYEEPDANVIKRYPRAIESIRDTINKEKKTRRAEAREAKKQEKQAELKRLRKLKREETESRVSKLKKISGNQNIDINDLDLNVIIDDENDFDMEKYDQKMQLLFGDSYYNTGDEEGKPSFEYIPEIDDDLYDDGETAAGSKANKKKKLSKKEIKQMRDIMADDDIGIYEDLIGGEVATRFRYRMVEPNDFGLTDEEILYADDKELNKWCSLKKMSQYRTNEDETRDKRAFGQKSKNMDLKKKIFQSIYLKKKDTQPDEGEETKPGDEVTTASDLNGVSSPPEEIVQSMPKKKKKRGKKGGIAKQTASNIHKADIETNKPAAKVNSPLKKAPMKTAGNGQKVPSNVVAKASRKRKRNGKPNGKSKSGSQMEAPSDVTAQRLKAYGMSNREIKKLKVRR